MGAINMDCERCEQVYSAILKRGGASWPSEIARDTRMCRGSVKTHLGHLMEMNLVERDSLGMYWIKLKEIAQAMEEKGIDLR